MSTRCLIAEKVHDGYRAIYCHNDGYPGGVGVTLQNYYRTTTKIELLLNQGDISILGTEPIDRNGEKYWNLFDKNTEHYFPTKENTISYKSRGENAPATLYPTINSMRQEYGIEFIYVWQNGHWTCYKNYKNY
jgi:hypothetical protein